MITIEEILAQTKATKRRPDEEELRHLPDRKAVVHGRLSGFNQVKESKESVREIAGLVALAIEDGYHTNLEPSQVQSWLEQIQAEVVKPGVLDDGDVIVNCLGLGVSGSLPEEKRPDLALDMELLKKHELGAIYVTEGANRLSRDPDGVVSATLLKLMKESNCKLRTPEEVLSPRIERDWQVIHDELEEGAEELKAMRKRLHRRKERKAARGEFVGEPVVAGFIVPIVGQAANGKYRYSRLEPYPPHAGIVTQILKEYVRQRGSGMKTVQALADLTFPPFPSELAHMERLSALRLCPKTPTGYRLTPALVKGLATNLKLIGVWRWGDATIPSNHAPVVPEDVFLSAYQLATGSGKPRGRAVNSEPLEWGELLWCHNHPNPRLVSDLASKGAYRCQRDYLDGRGPICLHIDHRFIDEPLTSEVLRRLDFSGYAEEVLTALEAEVAQGKVEETQRRREIAELERKLENLRPYLGCGDPEREEVYWERYKDTKGRLDERRKRPVPRKAVTIADIEQVKEFLVGLPHRWRSYSRSLRNQLLKLLIQRVELRHQGTCIEASIIWKAGLEQRIVIHRPVPRSGRESCWTKEEDAILRMLWPTSPKDVLHGALPRRTWVSMSYRAHRLGLNRERQVTPRSSYRRWSGEEEARALAMYQAGLSLSEIGAELGRSRVSILSRVKCRGWNRPRAKRWKKAEFTWEVDHLKGLERESLTAWPAP